MKKQIIHISPIQTAKVLALVYFLLSIPLVASMFTGYFMGPAAPRPSIFILVGMPIMYLIFGFVFTAVGALIYNFATKWIGGIEYTTVDKE